METIIITSEAEIKRWISEVIRQVLREELAASKAKAGSLAPGFEEPLLTRKEIAYLHISLVTLHDWINKGLVPYIRNGGRILFLKSEVLEALKDRSAKRG